MGPITYAAVLVILFVVGTFIFSYFETPRKTIQRGFTSLDKRVKNLSKIKVFPLNKKSDKALTVGLTEADSTGKENNSNDLRIYVHEY